MGSTQIPTPVPNSEYPYPRPSKLSYLSVPGQSPLVGLTIGQLIDATAAKFPDNDGLIVSDIGLKRSFAELKVEIDNLAAGLLKLGMKRGGRIGIWGPNSHQYYLTQMAAWKAGLILVNINSAYQPKELLYCMTNVGVQCLVIAENFKTQNYYEMVCKVVPEIPTCKPGELQSSVAPELKTILTMESKPLPGTFTVQHIMENGKDPSAKQLLVQMEAATQFDDVCNIQFTSGTTGHPKGAMLSHHNIVNNSYFIGKRFSFTDKDRICLTVPLFHCYGCVIGTLVALHYGSACIFPASAFSGLASITAAAKEKCTVVYGTPTMHIAMMNVPDFESYDLSSLRLACTAGAICPEELIKEMKTKYTVETVGSLYGMTETSPVFFQSLPTDTDSQRSGTVGYPMEHCEVKIVDAAGKIVPLGTAGEMCARGYVTMRGYWNDPEKTADILKSTKWLHTGDMMVMLDSGHSSIVGRLKDTIIRGGENIYPKEVEEYLHTHQKIMEAQVFGVPDYRMGEEVAAWVLVKQGQSLTEEEVKAYCKGNIAHYKIPRFIMFVEDFPKTASGKIQKFRMRDEMLKKIQHHG